jgi:hypothetical protein
MSSKRDPIVAVLHFFTHADLPLAEQGLALARDLVRQRRREKGPAKPTGKKTPAAAPERLPASA